MHFTHVIRIALLALLAASASACGGADPEPTFAELAVSQRAELAAQVDRICDCYDQLPVAYPDEPSCIEALTVPPDPTVEDCQIAAYELAPESSRDHVECQLEVASETTACLDEIYTCADTSTAQLCDEMRQAALDACPPLATIVIDAQIACAG